MYENAQTGHNKGLELTVEDIDTQEYFRNLSPEQKLELISLVYVLSLALYNSYSKGDE